MTCKRPLQPCERNTHELRRLGRKVLAIIDDPMHERRARAIAPWDYSEEPTPEASHPNLPTPAGRALGLEVARLVDAEEARLKIDTPGLHPRCVDCAARAGTLPNGCEETLMDFLKCAIEGRQFNCHKGVPEGETPSEPCRGWLVLQTTREDTAGESVGKLLGRRLEMAR